MTWLRILALRIKGLFGKNRRELELDAEFKLISKHLPKKTFAAA